MTKTASDVDKPGTTGVIQGPTALDKFTSYLTRRAETEQETGSYNYAEDLANRMFAAETVADLWDADEGGITAAKNLLDTELEIRGYRVLKGNRDDYDNGTGHYYIVDAVRLSDGAEQPFNTGALGLMIKLRAFEALDAFPIRCFIKGVPASEGTVLKLRPVAQRAL